MNAAFESCKPISEYVLTRRGGISECLPRIELRDVVDRVKFQTLMPGGLPRVDTLRTRSITHSPGNERG